MNTDKKLTAKGEIITGYKTTDENLCCRGFKFEIGKWYSHDGGLELCESGFHFCEYPSGPWAYYARGRLFEVEAMEVLLSTGPGADLKHVAKHIRLVKELQSVGNRNTGYGNIGDVNIGDVNTGDGNTGNRNTGNRNTGNKNTGYGNIGDVNTGDGNTGYRNTGNRNTGNRNTGNRNTGYGNIGDVNTGDGNTGYGNTGNRNTGNRNTGNKNTGYGNIGDGNTGYGNTGDFHSGSLNFGNAKFFMFNEEADRNDVDFDLVKNLCSLIECDDPIDPLPFLSLPNATPEKILALHNAHIRERNAYRQRNA